MKISTNIGWTHLHGYFSKKKFVTCSLSWSFEKADMKMAHLRSFFSLFLWYLFGKNINNEEQKMLWRGWDYHVTCLYVCFQQCYGQQQQQQQEHLSVELHFKLGGVKELKKWWCINGVHILTVLEDDKVSDEVESALNIYLASGGDSHVKWWKYLE